MAPEVPAGTAMWLARGEQDLPSGDAWLTADEAARASGMPFTKRRTEYLLRRWVCKRPSPPSTGLPEDPRSLARIEVTNRPSGAPAVVVDGVETGARRVAQRPSRLGDLPGRRGSGQGGLRPRDRRAPVSRVSWPTSSPPPSRSTSPLSPPPSATSQPT